MANAWILKKNGRPAQAFEFTHIEVGQPGPDEVRIATEVSGINFADVVARLGLYPEAPPLPFVLGYEVVGCIDAVGSNVNEWRVGQRVLAFTRFGGYATSVVTHRMAVAELPSGLSAAQGAALGTQYCTAWLAIEEMVRVHPGDRVLIHAAAGGVGTALVQLAKLRSCEVFGTTGSPAKLDYLRSIGVDHPILGGHGFVPRVRSALGDHKLDVVFDSLGGNVFRQSFGLLGAGGRMVAYGVAEMAGPRKNPFRALATLAGFGIFHPLSLLMSSRGIIGINMLRVADERKDVLQRCLQSVVRLAAEGKLDPKVGRVFKAAELPIAHEYLASRQSTGKVVIEWG